MSDFADRFTVVIDANVLVGALPRNLVLSFAEAGFFRVRWSRETLQEVERVLERLYGSDVDAKAQVERIQTAFPEAIVDVNDHLISSLNLPDPNDHHVLGAAIQSKAAVIVTENMRDFPKSSLDPHDVEAMKLDCFLADCMDLAGIDAAVALRTMRARFKNPSIDAEVLVRKMERLGLLETAKIVSEYKAVL